MKKVFLFLLILGLFLPGFASAAEFYFSQSNLTANTSRVDLLLDSGQQTLNAVQGIINFPKDGLNLKEIIYGDTIIVFWIDKPTIKNNSVSFSGIIPGGYLGSSGKIMSLVFEKKANGLDTSTLVDLFDTEVLANDGLGTKIYPTIKPIEIVFDGESIPEQPITTTTDIFPPEFFTLSIGQDGEMYNGKYFLVFDTQDKQSGLERYELLETSHVRYNKKVKVWEPARNENWSIAQSPYVLEDQKLESYIFVRAIDKESNIRTVYLLPQNAKKWYNYYILIPFALFVVLVFVFYVKHKNKNH